METLEKLSEKQAGRLSSKPLGGGSSEEGEYIC
jgi:hypothetical protein